MSDPVPSPAEAWLEVSDGLVSGVHHALNNRVAAVSALAQLLALGGAPSPDTEHALLDEVGRFEGTLRLLRLLPRDPEGVPIPLHLPELLPEVLALVALHREIREVRYDVHGDPDVLPLVAEESALLRALLVLLVRAGEAARSGEVSVRYGGDERFVVLEVLVEGASGGAPDGGIAATFAEVGGEVRALEAGWEVRMPTLLEVRSREGR